MNKIYIWYIITITFLIKTRKMTKKFLKKNNFLYSYQKLNKNFTPSCFWNIKSFSVLLVFTLLFDLCFTSYLWWYMCAVDLLIWIKIWKAKHFIFSVFPQIFYFFHEKIKCFYDGSVVSNFILKFFVFHPKFLFSFQNFWFPSKIFVFLTKFIFWFPYKIFDFLLKFLFSLQNLYFGFLPKFLISF